MLIKIIIWYILGSMFWGVMFGFLMATHELQVNIIASFGTLTIGLFIGLLLKEYFLKKPWLIMFLPILHFIVGMF